MPMSQKVPTCRAAALAAVLVIPALPLAAQERGAPDLGALIPTDAIRLEVAPERLQDCPALTVWAFDLPGSDAGFGPVLPEVPVGYGPSCAVIPQDDHGAFEQLAKP